MNLSDIYYKLYAYTSDKGTLHSYIPFYENFFNGKRHDPLNLLEIGVYHGGSIYMWRSYFSKAKIYGLDIDPITTVFHNPEIGVDIRLEDATKQETADRLPNFDIIIDDGSHILTDVVKSFNLFYPKLNSKGLYIIEDIQDLDVWKQEISKLGVPFKILDVRHVKNRYDDVIFVFEKE